MIRINCIQYLISPLIPHFPGKVLGKTDYFLNFTVNFPGKHKNFNFPGKFPGKSKKCVQRSYLIKIFTFKPSNHQSTPFWHGVVGPLLVSLREECVLKTCIFMLLGEQRQFLHGGRAAFTTDTRKTREFDATRGFPGEDINC